MQIKYLATQGKYVAITVVTAPVALHLLPGLLSFGYRYGGAHLGAALAALICATAVGICSRRPVSMAAGAFGWAVGALIFMVTSPRAMIYTYDFSFTCDPPGYIGFDPWILRWVDWQTLLFFLVFIPLVAVVGLSRGGLYAATGRRYHLAYLVVFALVLTLLFLANAPIFEALPLGLRRYLMFGQ